MQKAYEEALRAEAKLIDGGSDDKDASEEEWFESAGLD
jgi:hypothetical protein